MKPGFNRDYRPIDYIFICYANYNHLPFKFRQKIKDIQHYMLDIRALSHADYRVYLFDDGFAVVDITNNRFVWTENYDCPMPVLLHKFQELKTYWTYETNLSQINHYHNLKRIYSYE